MDGLNSDGLDALQTVAGIIDRAPTPQEVWYGHSILTSTLFPAVEPPAGTDYVSKRVGGVEYLLGEVSASHHGVDGEADSHERGAAHGDGGS